MLENMWLRLGATMYQGATAYRVRREEGQTLVEYALIIALVSVALVAALTALKTDIGAVFTKIGGELKKA